MHTCTLSYSISSRKRLASSHPVAPLFPCPDGSPSVDLTYWIHIRLQQNWHCVDDESARAKAVERRDVALNTTSMLMQIFHWQNIIYIWQYTGTTPVHNIAIAGYVHSIEPFVVWLDKTETTPENHFFLFHVSKTCLRLYRGQEHKIPGSSFGLRQFRFRTFFF